MEERNKKDRKQERMHEKKSNEESERNS